MNTFPINSRIIAAPLLSFILITLKIVDLTHPLFHSAPAFPNDPKMAVIQHGTIATHSYNISQLVMGSHQGTHLDAMRHFYADGRTIDRMPLDWFYGTAHVLRIPKQADAVISLEDLEKHSDAIQPDAKLFIETGWGRQFGDACFFDRFPSLSIKAAQFLAERKIRVLGLDMPSLGKEYLELHHILLHPDVEVVVVESVANLDQVPDAFVWAGFPLKLLGGDGSPIRSVAIFES